MLHRTNANVRRAQAERLPATTAIVDWYTSSRWSPLKMTATKVRMAHQAVPYRQGGQIKGETLCSCRRREHKGDRSKGKPFVAVAVFEHKGDISKRETLCRCRRVRGTRGADQRGNSLWLSPCPRNLDVLDLDGEITIGVAWRDMLSEGQSLTLGPYIIPVRVDFGRTK